MGLEAHEIPDPSQIRGAYLNYSYLLQLQKQGIIPSDRVIEKDELVTMQDVVDSVNDLAGYLGIGDLRIERTHKTYTRENTLIRSLSQYFWAETRGGITLCMVNVRRGLSRLSGVTISGVGDMVDIFNDGVGTYAGEVKEMFQKANK